MANRLVTAAAQELLDKRFRLNMSRVNRLISLAARIKNLEGYDLDEIADLHRSTVVFLFASFEDTLRSIENIYLSPPNNDKKRFSNVSTVVNLLRQLGLNINSFRPLFPEMATLMCRRHRIVHKADLVRPDAVTDAPWTIGDDYEMIIWLLLVSGFVSKLRAALDPSALVYQWFAEERTELIKKLTTARQMFLSVPPDKENFERKLQSLQNMLDTINEAQTMVNRPNDETAHAIADKYGIPH